MKLTKKQNEIVSLVTQLEKENDCTIYFMFDPSSQRIHPVKINDKTDNMTFDRFPAICTHTVATTMENKGVLISETLVKDDYRSFVLCKLNHAAIV